MSRLEQSVLAAWKFLLSFSKQNWDIHDYPIFMRCQDTTVNSASDRLRPYRYVAQIVNWPLAGGGETPEDAIQELTANFKKVAAARHQQGTRMPRPGTAVPVQFAARERINSHKELAADLIQRVLGLDWAWISDESSLWDFSDSDSNETLHARIEEVYGVDVSDIESGNLAEILDRIAAARA